MVVCRRPFQVFSVIWGFSLLYVFIFVWLPLLGYYGARNFIAFPCFVYAAYIALEVVARIVFIANPPEDYDMTASLRLVSIVAVIITVRRCSVCRCCADAVSMLCRCCRW